MTAWSMQSHRLFWLFCGRFATGVFSSNSSICLAAIADLSPSPEAKARYFGYFAALGAVAFVVGALLGGKLSDPTIYVAFSPHLPLWIASLFTGLNLLFVLWGFRETSTRFAVNTRWDPWAAFRNLYNSLLVHKMRPLYLAYFCFLFSWTLWVQLTPVLFVGFFHFTGSNLGDLALFIGLCWALGSAYANPWLCRTLSSHLLVTACLITFSLLSFAILGAATLPSLLLLLGGSVFIGGVAWPLCNALFSNRAAQTSQGKALGGSQSMQSLAMALAPLLGGLAFVVSPRLPFMCAAIVSLIACAFYLFGQRRREVD
jgi:MFS family permease